MHGGGFRPRPAVSACLLLLAALACGPAAAQDFTRPAYAPTPQPAKGTPTPERPSPFFDMLGEPFKGRKLSRPESPILGLAVSAHVVEPCGAAGSARVRLTASGFDPEGRPLRYRWAVSGGRVGGDAPEVVWDLSAVARGTYTARVFLEAYGGGGLASKETKVTVRECPRTRPPPPVCPSISLCCRASVTEGKQVEFVATFNGGTPVASQSVWWTLSRGRVVSGLGTGSIGVDTAGLGGQTLRATVEAGGYGLRCVSSCETLVAFAPAPTPAPTPNGHSRQSTQPTPQRPTPQPSIETTPTPSPAPSPSPTPFSDIEAQATPAETRELAEFLKYALWLLLLSGLGTASYLRFRGTGNAPPAPGGSADEAPPADVPPVVLPGDSAPDGTAAGDEVHCTVFAPPSAAPGDGFLVQAFAHLREQTEQLLEMANEGAEEARQVGSKRLAAPVERGTELVFSLNMPGLVVDEPVQSLVWDGEIDSVQFGVNVPDSFQPRSIFGTVTVSRGSVPIGHVKFMFKIAARAEQAAGGNGATAVAPPSQGFVRYRQAFISYASEDRAEVLKRVQMLKTVNINFFQDLLSIEPGDQWEQTLYSYIDRSDVIFLFWSTAAKRSQWVEREVQYALRRRAGNDAAPPEIVPVILEGPPIVPPPDYLQQLHFNDVFVYFIKAEEAAHTSASRNQG